MVLERFNRLSILTNRNKGSMGLVAQIEKLKSIYGGKIHLDYKEHDKEIDRPDVIRVRLCESGTKDDGYEFVTIPQNSTAGPTLLRDGLTAEPQKDGAHYRWTRITIELRSINDAIYFLGEWKREYKDDHLTT
ncbi:MAG: hypothetical protein AAF224_11850 [Pseudomonadota bacterium]